jgi:hypothetical protein
MHLLVYPSGAQSLTESGLFSTGIIFNKPQKRKKSSDNKIKMETEDIITESQKNFHESIFSAEANLYIGSIEEKDIEIFQKFVTPHYRPCKNPISMAVGAISSTERDVIKTYHQRQFGISTKQTMVASTNRNPKDPIYDKYPELHYDHESFGLDGDARMSHCYMGALNQFNQFDRNFDLVYIRNPDLLSQNNWEYIFKRALEWTAKDGGAVATLIRKNDIAKYNRLLNRLDNEFGIIPVFSGETKICTKNKWEIFSENHQHTIGIFKPHPS